MRATETYFRICAATIVKWCGGFEPVSIPTEGQLELSKNGFLSSLRGLRGDSKSRGAQGDTLTLEREGFFSDSSVIDNLDPTTANPSSWTTKGRIVATASDYFFPGPQSS